MRSLLEAMHYRLFIRQIVENDAGVRKALALEPTAHRVNERTRDFGQSTTTLMSKLKAGGKMAGLLGATRASAAREEDRLQAMHEENKRLTLFGQAGSAPPPGCAPAGAATPSCAMAGAAACRRARRRLRWRTLPRSSRSPRRAAQAATSAATAAAMAAVAAVDLAMTRDPPHTPARPLNVDGGQASTERGEAGSLGTCTSWIDSGGADEDVVEAALLASRLAAERATASRLPSSLPSSLPSGVSEYSAWTVRSSE